MTYQGSYCVDAGSENCPCPLAQSGDCITCSLLQGKDVCQCDWQGVCVYNEYIQNGERINNKRKNKRTQILKKTWYGEDLVVFVLRVSKGFALKAALPGSYVFLKPPELEDCYSVPLSVMRADPEKGELHLAVKVVAGKTKALSAVRREVALRGVYRNGLFGLSKLMKKEPQKILCLCKGVGFAPVANYNTWAFGKDRVDMVVDLDKINHELVNDYLQACPVNRIEYKALQPDMKIEDRYDAILLSASDYYLENLPIPKEKLVCSNNFHMCCGEGICGACTMVDERMESHKMCKCRLLDFP